MEISEKDGLKTVVVENAKVAKKIFLKDNRYAGACYLNKLTGREYRVTEGFRILFRDTTRRFRKKTFVSAENCLVEADREGKILRYVYEGVTVTESYDESRKDGTLCEKITVKTDGKTAPDGVYIARVAVPKAAFSWSAPLAGDTFIPAEIARLGQPVYIGDMFFGLESPVGDNFIKSKTADFFCVNEKYPVSEQGGVFETESFVAGAALSEGYESVRESFFSYLCENVRKPLFRIQYNSWYDNKLDITHERIEKSFRLIAEGAKRAGLGALDCYVVDDGWTEYDKPLFWEFNKKFDGGFEREKELVKELGSTFGVWFGPRGGYTSQTYVYAKLLESIGYGVNEDSRDICTADARYIEDLCGKMAEFCKRYDVDYFKIDGFAYKPCKSAAHRHAPAERDCRAFYSGLWRRWIKGFEKIREANKNVCLNVTSYAHLSPWFLKYADFVWMNNASDMEFVGKGSNMQRCLNYRDGRYRDLFIKRQYQFPAAHVYNHEPTYAARNYASRKDAAKNKPITYTDEEFSVYLRCCLMRGSGLAELYFSPEMMTDEKWKIAARELGFAKKHADVLGNSRFFGGRPERGEVYGYIAIKGDKYVLMLRNSGNKKRKYSFDLPVVGRVEGWLEGQEIRFSDNVR